MKHPVIILAAALAVGGAAVAAQHAAADAPAAAPQQASGAGIVHAHADIAGEGISGTAEFTESQQATGKLVTITVTVKGLKPGMHGVHLHAVGKCTPDPRATWIPMPTIRITWAICRSSPPPAPPRRCAWQRPA